MTATQPLTSRLRPGRHSASVEAEEILARMVWASQWKPGDHGRTPRAVPPSVSFTKELTLGNRSYSFSFSVQTEPYKDNRWLDALVDCTYTRSHSWGAGVPDVRTSKTSALLRSTYQLPQQKPSADRDALAKASYEHQYHRFVQPVLDEARGAERRGNTDHAAKLHVFAANVVTELRNSVRL